jgi:hypothetical protein
MSKIVISADVLAKIKHFADGGDMIATGLQAIFDGVRTITLSKDVEGTTAANTIRISGQVTELDGTLVKAVTDIFITSTPIAGVGTMTIGTKGALKKGTGTVAVWLQTNSSGAFEIDVLNASVEDNLVRFETDNGEVEVLKLTFA